MGVLKYFIGGLICLCFIVFCVKQVKSVVDDIRDRRKSKLSKEVEEGSTAQSDEGVEKEVDKE